MKRLNETISTILSGIKVGKHQVIVPNSRFVRNTLNVLQQEGYVGQFVETEDTRNLILDLLYHKGKSVIRYMKFLSTSGSRSFTKKITSMPRNFTVRILTTSKGVMSHMDAIKNNVGGQLLLEVF